MNDFNEFLLWEMASQDTIDFKKVYVDMSGDLVAGLLLSQIVYWHLPNKSQQTKLRVNRDGKMWIAKSREEWYDEIRISTRQFDRAIRILESEGIVESNIYKFGKEGKTIKHVRLIQSEFLKKLGSTVRMNEFAVNDSESSENDSDFTANDSESSEKNTASEKKSSKKNSAESYSHMGFDESVNPDLTKGEIGNLPLCKSGFDESVIPSYTENTDIDYCIDNQSEITGNSDLHSLISNIFEGNLTKRKTTDLIDCYDLYADKITIHDYKRILVQIKPRMKNIRTSFKNYIIKTIKNYIKEQNQYIAAPEKPVRKESVPDWMEKKEKEGSNVPDSEKKGSSNFEEEKRKLEEELKQYRPKE